MLFNPRLDVFTFVDYTMAFIRFVPSSAQVAGNAILDSSCALFLLIADVTRLARLQQSSSEKQIQRYQHVNERVCQYDTENTRSNPCVALYASAMRVLMSKIAPNLSGEDRQAVLRAGSQQGFAVISNIDMRRNMLGFSLWPLAVLGSTALTFEEQGTVDSQIVSLAAPTNGQVLRVRRRLHTIWRIAAVQMGGVTLEKRLELLLGCH